MNLFIEALDLWLFRDGKPFDAGGQHLAQSMFPPFPSVMQGAVRSNQLVLKNVDLWDKKEISKMVGTANDLNGLKLKGPFLACSENNIITLFYPQPADAVSTDIQNHKIRPASPPEPVPSDILTSGSERYLLGFKEDLQKGESGLWLSEDHLLRYLAGDEVEGIPSDQLFCFDSHLGIGMDYARKITETGQIYQVRYVSPHKGVGLLLEVLSQDYSDWPESGMMRLGGEARAATYTQVSVEPIPQLIDNYPKLPDRFKVYFTTPTWFEKGWEPISWQKFFEGNLVLRTAAIGRYRSVGGFDMENSIHKPALRYVPAGSVYYFETLEKSEVSVRPGLENQAISDYGNDFGFGQFIIGRW